MSRVKRGVTTHARHKKILKMAKGYRGRSKIVEIKSAILEAFGFSVLTQPYESLSRFRPSFFPFTEPSAELDINCSRENGQLKIGTGDNWLEILGCGMVHPTVLKNCGIDPNEFQGFAFGAGVERFTMLKYGLPDIRALYDSDEHHLETDKSLHEIAAALNGIGLELEGIDNPADRLQDFVVAKVVEAGKHPNADRLNLCQVDDGSEKLLQVVCGGTNVRQGMKIAFARVGTIIPVNGQVLKAGNIRGMDSLGMICSAQELLLSNEESDGSIMDLETDATLGSPLAAALGLDDAVIEVSVGPNRSDCFSVRGIARDLAAYGIGTLKPLKMPEISPSIDCSIKVSITDPACSHFTGRLIEGVQNKESPLWMQSRLKAVGQKCISALVDVTNYVSLDIGRPLHVFDADKLKGDIVVRPAKAGETMKALDGKVYELEDGMTTISDSATVLSLAGVMGGLSSGCAESTTRVFIESAYFDPIRIAKTGQSLRILSEARTRFERGVDPADVILGLDFAAHYILQHCGGKVSQVVEAGKKFGTGVVELEAPLSQEMAVMRPSILPGHLKAISNNQSKSLYNSAFFEVASSHPEKLMLLIAKPMHWQF
eukprot:gene16050-16219_t